MANTPLNQLGIEELKKKASMLKVVVGIFSGMLILMTLIGVFLVTKQGFNVFAVLPIAFLPLLMVNLANLKKVNDELKTRSKS
jgi:uncharacterized membrane protein YdbT with pleckstrin-like domain